MPTAVSNSSPLILYSKIGRLDLLRAVFSDVIVPPAVWHEVVESSPDHAGVHAIRAARWIRVRKLSDQSTQRLPSIPPLDPGETEAILLAHELGAGCWVILDDLNARRVARALELDLIGSAGLLLRAKRQGVVAAIAPVLDQLEAAGLYLSEGIRRNLLIDAGEVT